MMSKDRTTTKGKEAMRLQLFSRMMEYEKSIEEQDYISGVVDHFMYPNSRCETDEVPLDVITNDTQEIAERIYSDLTNKGSPTRFHCAR